MKFKYALVAPLLIVLSAALSGAGLPQVVKRSRTFEFIYDTQITNLPPDARTARVWIPLASSDRNQSVTIEKITAGVPVRVTRDPRTGDRILYAEIHNPRARSVDFTIKYRVTRREYSKGDYTSLMRYNADPVQVPVTLVRFTEPDRLIPTGGIIRRIAQTTTRDKSGEISKAYALYNYVFHNMRYDKSGKGWGRGDALFACNAKRGNCTDFHSLFIALMRSEGIPARFVIGFPLPEDSSEGRIPGYHCWAEFYVRKLGWVPVDISEAWLNPARHDFYFGSLDPDRVRISKGRDLTLSPKQAGPPVNYFVYPYAEVDGKPFNSFKKQFSFHDLTPAHIAAAASHRPAR